MYEEELNALDKDELNWLVRQFLREESTICEILVDESTCHISQEQAIKDIRNQLKSIHLSYHNSTELKAEIQYKMGKITRKECRRIIGLD